MIKLILCLCNSQHEVKTNVIRTLYLFFKEKTSVFVFFRINFKEIFDINLFMKKYF